MVPKFAKTYSQMTDNQLLGLYVARDVFLPEALSALLAEFRKRFRTEPGAAALAEQRSAVEWARQSSDREEADPPGAFGRR